MSYTIGNFCYSVKTYLQKYSSEARPSNSFIYSIGKNVRSAMLTSKLNDKAKLFNVTSYQTIPVFPMVESDPIDFCGIRFQKSISKSVYKLPKLLDTDTGIPAARIFLIDFSDAVDFLSPEEIIGNSTRRYKYPGVDAFIVNDFLYITKITDGVKIMGLWKNPEEIDSFTQCNEFDSCGKLINTSCDTPMLEKEFPIPAGMIEGVELKTTYNIARFYGISLPDTKNDSKDESARPGNLPGEDKQ